MKTNTTRLGSLTLFCWLALSPSAHAAVTTDTFLVSANVSATCTVSANDLTFGDYARIDLPATSTISVTCTNGTEYHARMNQGLNGTSVTDRKMKLTTGADTLNYGLYRDAGHTQNWGETDDVDTTNGTGDGSAQSLTVYGLIPGSQNPSVGTYNDTITVTLSY